jgi:hypothetical protein
MCLPGHELVLDYVGALLARCERCKHALNGLETLVRFGR